MPERLQRRRRNERSTARWPGKFPSRRLESPRMETAEKEDGNDEGGGAGKVTTLVTRKIKAAKSKRRGNEVKMGRRPHLCSQETVITEVYGGDVIIKITIFNVSMNMDIIALYGPPSKNVPRHFLRIKRNNRPL